MTHPNELGGEGGVGQNNPMKCSLTPRFQQKFKVPVRVCDVCSHQDIQSVAACLHCAKVQVTNLVQRQFCFVS